MGHCIQDHRESEPQGALTADSGRKTSVVTHSGLRRRMSFVRVANRSREEKRTFPFLLAIYHGWLALPTQSAHYRLALGSELHPWIQGSRLLLSCEAESAEALARCSAHHAQKSEVGKSSHGVPRGRLDLLSDSPPPSREMP